MSQAEELLNSLSAGVPMHSHPVPDTDTYFTIDPITRQIENTNRKKAVVMQYDHNSERFTFELPRYVDGHDMLECTSITVNVDNIEAETNVTNSDAPDMTDLRINPKNPDMVISSWLISRNLTQLAGILSFSIEYKCVDTDGNVVYEWSTDIFNEVEVRARKKNGEAAVIEHSDLLEQWRTRIFGAGDSVMANIATEGEAQVAAVKAESETQQEVVELKGAQTLDTIPEDYTEVDAMADEAIRFKGDAIVCEASGESIVLKDSSDDYIRGLKLFGKTVQRVTTGAQLMPQPYYDSSMVRHGVTFTVNDDGSITMVGTNTAGDSVSCYFMLHSGFSATGIHTYKCYGLPETCVTNIYYRGDVIADSEILLDLYEPNEYGFVIRVKAGATVNATVYPMLNAGETALPYEPYTGGKPSPSPEYPQEIASIENPTINVHGKNLLHDVYASDYITHNGVTYSDAGDGKLSVKGTATANSSFAFASFAVNKRTPISAGTYTVSGNPSDDVYFGFYLYDSQSASDHSQAISRIINDKSWTFTIDKDSYYGTYVHVPSGNTVDTIISPQLEIGSKATAYEPPSTKQSLSISDHTLPGIPVTSGGNYTDENGQQWICDEVDLERGVYIQRTMECEYDGSEDERWKKSVESYFYLIREQMPYRSKPNGVAMSTRFRFVKGTLSEPGLLTFGNAYGPMLRVTSDVVDETGLREWIANNPFSVLYELETPIETPLTAEEITAFKALKTNYPNTTILNDAGAWMSVKYNADTKSYVENPKVLKLVDSSTGVVYELKVVDGNLTVSPIE